VLVPAAVSQERGRSELVDLQRHTGLSLVSVRDNTIYTVSFEKKAMNGTRIVSEGTVVGGYFSDDGTRIAAELCRKPGITHPTPYRTECPGGFILAILRSDGTVAHEYPDIANPWSACWSRDGSKIALVANDQRKGRYAPLELQILDLATEETQVISDGEDSFADPQCWSPDDKQVVYTSSNMALHPVVSIYDVAAKTSREFSRGTRPTWSPDGNWIALLDCPPSLRGCTYYAVSRSGRERKALFQSESATALWWSPDSRFVAYVNSAEALERRPSQMEREMVRLRVRKLEDNSVSSFVDFFDGDTMYFQWLRDGIPASQPSSPRLNPTIFLAPV
jgi:tricorn protease-like protein